MHRLHELLNHPRIWKAGRNPVAARATVSTGFVALDQALAGGWPVGTLVELLLDNHGVGELRLLMPALARLSVKSDERGQAQWIMVIDPPYIPYAPALARQGVDIDRLLVVHCRRETDVLWAMEQALHSGTCAAVLAWAATADDRALRRLQLAAEAQQSWAVLFRPSRCRRQRSPAAVRLHLCSEPSTGIRVHVVKNRGGRPQMVVMDA